MAGPFSFTINGGAPVTVNVGNCSAPIEVPAGTATVVETPVPFAQVTAITTLPDATRLVSANLGTGTAVVRVPAGDISNTTTVTYTNRARTGFIEICKNAAPGSGLTGSFTFTITGPMGFSATVTVPVGACSNSILVPAGSVVVTETGDARTFVTSITTQPASALLSFNLANATATVAVAAGDVSTETIVTFTNSTSVLKICKVAGATSLLGQNYTFTATPGPGAATSSVTIPAGAPPSGNCQVIPGYRTGTTVSVAEGVVPGTQVSSITVAPPDRLVAGSIDLANRTVSVVLGSGETVVTYTNIPAPPGTLKICKTAGPGVAAGSMWTFTVAGMTGTVSVPAGSCMIVGPFPFNSTQTITETAQTGFVVTAITVNPADRLVSANPAGRTVTLIVGSGVTEATFTNAAGPPATPGSSSTGPGSSGSALPPGTSATSSAATSAGAGATVLDSGRASLASAYLIRKHGKVYLVLLVRSKNGHSVTVTIKEYNRHGKLVGKLNRTVKSNHKVQVLLPSKPARFAASVKG
ncbi:MAG: hypothetical protein JO046_02590 [Solirubrobacterales bacterium]|nr:hypothetical protein [Solirubrobacterales bacterium]